MTKQQMTLYLRRIGYDGPVTPTAGVLRDLQQAHFFTVPYENLDILAGRRLSLDEDRLFDKVVTRRRGGFCFELNALFKELLTAVGFSVTSHFARFLLNESEIPKRRHHVLRVMTPEGPFLGDVGVGVSVPLRSLRIELDSEQRVPYGVYRFRSDGFLGWVMQEAHDGGWRDLLSFTDEGQLPVDFVTTSYFCEAAPESIFNKKIMLSLKTPQGRVTMDGREFKRFSPEGADVKTLDDAGVETALDEVFGIRLPGEMLAAALALTDGTDKT